MSSTFSPRLRIELIGAGEQSGAWNNTTNTNLGTLIEEAIAGVVPISLSGTTYTLDEADGATDEARQMVLVFTGTLSGAATITCPTVEKTYIVKNATSGNYKITMKTSAGGSPVGVDIPNGSVALVYTDGTDFFNAVKELAADATSGGVPIVTTTGSQTIADKTLTAPKFADNGFIADPSGNQILSFGVTASAVNEVKVTNAATGAGPTISSDGGDTDIDLLLVAKGTGVVKADGVEVATVSGTQTLSNKTLTAPKFADLGFIADANGNELIVMDTVSSSVNELKVANAAAGGYPSIVSQGDDTDISLSLAAKGAGTVRFGSVASFGAGTGSAPSISATGDLNTGIWFPAADTIAFSTNGTEDFRIGPSGQLGIGGANYGTSGQVLTSGGPSAAPTWSTPAGLTVGTAISTNSGTSGVFTGLPSGINRITMSFYNVLNPDYLLVQLGTSSGYATSGYSSGSVSAGGNNTSTSGFIIRNSGGGQSGNMTLTRVSGNNWVASHGFRDSAGGGLATMSGTVDRIRVVSTNSTAFTGGSVNIMYE